MSTDPETPDFVAPEIEELSRLLPSYEIISFIAKGGMGAVYKARQKSLDRDVAIKVLPRHFGADAEFRASFQAEAKSMAKFNHPNLIGIYDFGQVDGLLYIIMELVSGESLYHHSYGKTIDPNKCSRFIKETLKGLSSAHKYDVLHRDIKPANILLDENLSPKIGDFGLARPVGDHESDTAFGTPGYTAPEVVHDPKAVDASTDLYAVGVMLYELLTGKIPDSIYEPASTLVGCDPTYDRIIQKAIHPTPAMRFRDAESFIKALEKIPERKTGPTLLAAGTASSGASAPANKLVTSPGSPAPNKNPSSVSPVKTGDSTPFIRNIIIIIALLAAIYITWETLNKTKENRQAKQEQVEAKKKADKEKKELERKQKLAKAKKTNPKPKKNRPTIVKPPVKKETPMESLSRLKTKLASGDRSQFPKSSFERAGRTRMFIEKPMTWYQAQAFCEKYGGHLAVLPTSEDLAWLSGKLKSDQTVWLGGGTSGKGKWNWIDSTEWAQEIRNTSKASFVAVNDTGILQPLPEATENSFFIEWKQDGTMDGTLEKSLKRCAKTLNSPNPIYPPGTITYDNRHYLLVTRKGNWFSAKRLAKLSGGHLACPSNETENIWMIEFINNAIEEQMGCWLAGFRAKDDSVWKWNTGERWEFATWREGAPNTKLEFAAAIVIRGTLDWASTRASSHKSHFLIEWSDDAKGLTPSNDPAPPAANSELAELRGKCNDYIKKIEAKYAKDFETNIKIYEQELNTYIRGLTKSQLDAQGDAIKSMMENYPSERIPKTISRDNMPEKVAKTLDERLEKQAILHQEYLIEVEKLRTNYHSKIKTISNSLLEKGLRSQSEMVLDEIKNTGDVETFIQHVTKDS